MLPVKKIRTIKLHGYTVTIKQNLNRLYSYAAWHDSEPIQGLIGGGYDSVKDLYRRIDGQLRLRNYILGK